MNTKNIFRISSYLCGLCLLCVLCVSCEDYTEHNFGTPEELWQAQQVNNYVIELTPQNYADLAANADNQALAAQDEKGVTSAHLQKTAESGSFVGNITPQEYLPAILKSLVGTSQYYSMTNGSSITIKYKTGEIVSDAAYVPCEGELTQSGKYLLVPAGQEQVLVNSNNAATGQEYTYGYIYLSGSTRCPDAVTRVDDHAILANEVADKYLYSIEKDGSAWLICNPNGLYLCLDDSHNTFQYIDDLGDIEDEQYPSWNISYNETDQTYDIVNADNGKKFLYGLSYSSAGAYPAETYLDEDGHLKDTYAAIQLYQKVEGVTESVVVSEEEEEITFTLEDGQWQAKGDYLNMELTGGNSLTDMDLVYQATGWSVEYIGSIGDLTYVWRYDSTYGLRASAYKSSTYYPTVAYAISPAMNLSKAEQPVFTFEQAQKYAGTPVTDYLKVYVSTDYTGRGGLEAATWTEVTDQVVGTWPDGSDWTYYPMTLDLSPFAGNKTVNVAFCYVSTDAVAATWEVKNVVCREFEESEEPAE